MNEKIDQKSEAKTAVKNKEIPTTDNKPKKSNNRCCVAIIVVFVLIVVVYFIVAFIASSRDSNSNRSAEEAINSATENQTAKPEISDQQLLDYFTSITFTAAGKNNQPCTAERWPNKTVTVSISGIPNEVAVRSVDNVIAQFNAISTTTKLAKVNGNGMMRIIFGTQAEMTAEGNKDPDAAIFGWARPNPDSNCSIQSAEIHISSEAFKSEMGENAVIVHEIGHALGFIGHDRAKIGCNALTDVACAPMETYNQYDTSAIKMLYNSGLPACANKSQAEEMFSNTVPR